MSLLDDVSIVVTPNGYKAGELYAVVPVPSYGSEQVTNGDFATDTDWTKGTGWTISGNAANFTYSIPSSLTQDLNVTSGLRYLIEYEIISNSGISLKGGGSNFFNVGSSIPSTVGLHSFSVTAVNSSGIEFRYLSGSGSLSIQNISIKEVLVPSADMDVTRATAATRVDEAGLVNYAEIVTGSDIVTNGDFANGSTDWTLQNGWSLGSNDVVFTPSASSYRKLFQVNFLTIGKVYKLSFEIKSISAGSIANFEPNSPSFNTVGVKTQTYVATFDDLYLEPTNDANLTIDNISVKEVTRDNVPRIDYSGGGCPHILAEPQRTNLITYSEDFSQWSNSGFETSNYSVSPDGTQNASRYLFTGSGQSSQILTSVSSGVEVSGSLYIKGVAGETIQIASGGADELFTLTSDWKRYDSTKTTLNSSFNINTYGGATARDVQVWGAQLESGSYATSYIPTSGSTVTRNQDQFSRDGIGSLINSTEGVLFVEVATLVNSGSFRAISLNDGSESNRAMIRYESTENNMYFFIISGGVVQAETLIVLSDSTDFNKLAISWKLNEVKSFINGVQSGVTDTSATPPTGLNTLSFNDGNNNEFFGKVKQLQVYKTALTDTQLAALTS